MARGPDVVVGFVETYGGPLTIEAMGDLEIVARRKILQPPLRHRLLPKLRGLDLRTVPLDEAGAEDATWMG